MVEPNKTHLAGVFETILHQEQPHSVPNICPVSLKVQASLLQPPSLWHPPLTHYLTTTKLVYCVRSIIKGADSEFLPETYRRIIRVQPGVVVVVVVHTSNSISSFPGGDLVGLKPNPPLL